jgi:hypothetical protein
MSLYSQIEGRPFASASKIAKAAPDIARRLLWNEISTRVG